MPSRPSPLRWRSRTTSCGVLAFCHKKERTLSGDVGPWISLMFSCLVWTTAAFLFLSVVHLRFSQPAMFWCFAAARRGEFVWSQNLKWDRDQCMVKYPSRVAASSKYVLNSWVWIALWWRSCVEWVYLYSNCLKRGEKIGSGGGIEPPTLGLWINNQCYRVSS